MALTIIQRTCGPLSGIRQLHITTGGRAETGPQAGAARAGVQRREEERVAAVEVEVPDLEKARGHCASRKARRPLGMTAGDTHLGLPFHGVRRVLPFWKRGVLVKSKRYHEVQSNGDECKFYDYSTIIKL